MQNKFGEVIKSRRLSKGISQDVLAEMSNLSRNYVSDVERGTRNISLNNIMKLFKALKIEIELKYK